MREVSGGGVAHAGPCTEIALTGIRNLRLEEPYEVIRSSLSTVAAGATTSFLAGQRPSAALVAQVTVHGYTRVFWWATALLRSARSRAACCCAVARSGPRPRQARHPRSHSDGDSKHNITGSDHEDQRT
jgi:hypothetical protein